MTTTTTQTTLIAKTWTGRTGEVRHYINAFGPAIDLDVDYYKSGNVSDASLRGEDLSNAEALRILGSKVWIDAAGTVHVTTTARVITEDEIRAAVEACRIVTADGTVIR